MSRDTIRLPRDAYQLLQTLRAAGHSAYVVGGCVRDSLLGRLPGDWDICTSARPDQLRAIFHDQRLILTGEKHGTVAVILHGKPYEITTYRLDGIEYKAVRYSSHVRNIPILRVRCEVCDPSALAAEGDPKRLRVQRFLHYGLPVLVCLVLAVVWVCTRNMPLWPDKAAMLLMLGALGIGYGFRGWYLYYNDRDQ